MKILLTGCYGQLGRCFLDRVPDDWEILATDYKELDITSEREVIGAFSSFKPDVVVNAAAYTAVDNAEQDQENAHAINAMGPKHLAETCAKTDTFMVHVSTDYVFDGTTTKPYRENEPISPNSVYGKTKAEGEAFVSTSGADYIILRTAWLFSEYGNNFVKTMLRLGQTRSEIDVVADQFGGPTYAGDLASAIIKIIENRPLNSGIYHYCGYPLTSWADFAREIFSQGTVIINDITSAEYPTAAARPAYSMLNCEKIKEHFTEIELSDWQNALLEILMELK